MGEAVLKVLIGLIRVMTLINEESINKHGRIIEDVFPELKVISRCIEGHPLGLYDFESERTAIPEIVRVGKVLEDNGAKAIVVSCANDPGINELKRTVNVPVIGAGSSCASLASIYGTRVGVLGITDLPPTPMVKILNEKLFAYEKPYGIKTATDIAKNYNAIIESAMRLVEQNIDVLALGCTGFSTLEIAGDLERRFNILVIDPVVAAGLYAYYAAVKRPQLSSPSMSGVSH